MQNDYWLERWQSNDLGWQRNEYHPALVKHWPSLPKRSRVLVPLCGKTHDLIWLAEQGHQVFGVELSEDAVEQFFSEHGLNYHSHYQADYQHFQCVELSIHILVGDFFRLTRPEIPFDLEKSGFDAIYDRAALVALPKSMRQAYVDQCLSLLKKDYCGLLITFDYPQDQMAGPPFSVSDAEVDRLYQAAFTRTERFNLLIENSPFSDSEFDYFNEDSWVVECPS